MHWQRKDSAFFVVVDKVGTFLFANFIWIVFSITILGIPFATLGLFAVMMAWVQGNQPEFFRVFTSAIREHWRKAFVIAAIDVGAGGLLFVNLSIIPMMNSSDIAAILSRSLTIFAGLVLLMGNIYVWPLVTIIDVPIGQLIKLVLILVLTYPLKSAAILLVTLLPLAASILLPIAFLLFVTVSLTAYLASYGAWFIVQRHFSPDELEHLIGKTVRLENKDHT